MTPLAGWQTFYEIVGSSAGALIGLQFVVLSLISARPSARPSPAAGSAYATPNIVHFGAVLGISAMLSAPWEGIATPAVLLALTGLAGVIYAVVVIRRMRRQTAYRPEFEDWLFYALLPLAAYLTLAGSGYAAWSAWKAAMFGVAAAVLALLFSGIHNAWDAVTYHVFFKASDRTTGSDV